MHGDMRFTHYLFLLFCLAFVTASNANEKKDGAQPNFTLLKGVAPVCKAYLNRLNKSRFTKRWPPYCGRPEVKDIPPFETLHRVYLNVEEIYKIYDLVVSFKNTSNQMYAKNIRKKSYLYPDKARSIRVLKREGRLGRLRVWRYAPMVDMDNDGQKDNVVIWFEQRSNRCGGTNNFDYYPTISAYIFNRETTAIDEKKTTKIFGNLDQHWPNAPGFKRFRPLNNESSVNIFGYKGLFYFDTFPSGNVYGSKIRNKIDLKVYLRQDKHTKNICQYHWNKRDL